MYCTTSDIYTTIDNVCYLYDKAHAKVYTTLDNRT
jgi:hypothetical protein